MLSEDRPIYAWAAPACRNASEGYEILLKRVHVAGKCVRMFSKVAEMRQNIIKGCGNASERSHRVYIRVKTLWKRVRTFSKIADICQNVAKMHPNILRGCRNVSERSQRVHICVCVKTLRKCVQTPSEVAETRQNVHSVPLFSYVRVLMHCAQCELKVPRSVHVPYQHAEMVQSPLSKGPFLRVHAAMPQIAEHPFVRVHAAMLQRSISKDLLPFVLVLIVLVR